MLGGFLSSRACPSVSSGGRVKGACDVAARSVTPTLDTAAPSQGSSEAGMRGEWEEPKRRKRNMHAMITNNRAGRRRNAPGHTTYDRSCEDPLRSRVQGRRDLAMIAREASSARPSTA